MTLDEYLASGIKTADDLAAQAKLSPASVSRIRKGLQKPSYDAIRAIVAATDGKVPAHVLLGLVA